MRRATTSIKFQADLGIMLAQENGQKLAKNSQETEFFNYVFDIILSYALNVRNKKNGGSGVKWHGFPDQYTRNSLIRLLLPGKISTFQNIWRMERFKVDFR